MYRIALLLVFSNLALAIDTSTISVPDLNLLDLNKTKIEEFNKVTKSISAQVRQDGYPFETHSAKTSDGYILELHRIPYAYKNQNQKNKPVVLLQHGLLGSSYDWILLGPKRALPYLLADEGFDVWMGNARGNTFSKKHASLSTESGKFWEFSWHEIGIFDLPAIIDYALGKTGKKRMQYIGFSQGTTSFFVMASFRPEYNKKIQLMNALAPVAFMGNMKNPFFRVLAPIVSQTSLLNNYLGNFEFMPNSKFLSTAGGQLCKDQSPVQLICANVLFLIAGFDTENLNKSMIPDILKVTPAGASTKQIIHYAQGHVSGKFRRYDYGVLTNMINYGTMKPPEYKLENINVPIALHYGKNDWLSAVEDVQTLAGKVKTVVLNREVPFKKWNHLDFLFGINAKKLVYDKVIAIMNKVEKSMVDNEN